jgi:hypothetical protein
MKKEDTILVKCKKCGVEWMKNKSGMPYWQGLCKACAKKGWGG